MTRRDLLKGLGAGFGAVGLAGMADAESTPGPLAAKAPHFPPRAKRVIFLFLNGGMSQVDTFDPKPLLDRRDGEPMPGPKVRTDRAAGNLMRSPFNFRKCGQSGLEVSEIFPKVGDMIDDFCVVRSMYADNGNHTPSLFLMNCGHQLPGRPSMGSWVTYGLGTENQDLPGFMVLCPGMPNIGPQLWSSAFLPSPYQGAYIPLRETKLDRMVQNIRNPELTPERQKRDLSLLGKLDRVLSRANRKSD